MTEKIKDKIVKDPFFTRLIVKARPLIDSGVLTDTENVILEEYITIWIKIVTKIRELSENNFTKCREIIDMGYSKTDPYSNNPPIKGDNAYIEHQLGIAMAICDSGFSWALDGYMNKAVNCLCATHSIFATTAEEDNNYKSLLDTIDKYRQGPKSKSKKSQENWAQAEKNLLEEIPLHKTLPPAREAAAKRAGINVKGRRLIEMLPVKK
jgi:hypothetical protein